jgi:hypothetical protein
VKSKGRNSTYSKPEAINKDLERFQGLKHARQAGGSARVVRPLKDRPKVCRLNPSSLSMTTRHHEAFPDQPTAEALGPLILHCAGSGRYRAANPRQNSPNPELSNVTGQRQVSLGMAILEASMPSAAEPHSEPVRT